MDTIIVEVRAAEGGDDAKDLVNQQIGIYGRYAARLGLDVTLLEARDGIAIFEIAGKGATAAFRNEAGGHRWQHVPKNQRSASVQTSTITVAVLPVLQEADVPIADRDLSWTFTVGSGAGGQHRNKTCTAAVVKHLPTGIIVRAESERSQRQNKLSALAILSSKLQERAQHCAAAGRNANRKAQVGIGARGDKRRTLRAQDDNVTDHVAGRTCKLRDYLRGKLEALNG